MDTERIVDSLLEMGVLVTEDEDTLSLSGSFEEQRMEYIRSMDDEAAVESELMSILDGSGRIPDTYEEQLDMLATYLAINDFGDDLEESEQLQTLPLIKRFTDPSIRKEGAPKAFTSVNGGQLRSQLRMSKRAVVYVWRENCDPCDAMKAEFDKILPASPDDVALLAIYGPSYPSVLREFDVAGAPTTLFVYDGSVDVRLHGAQYGDIIEDEIETLRRRV